MTIDIAEQLPLIVTRPTSRARRVAPAVPVPDEWDLAADLAKRNDARFAAVRVHDEASYRAVRAWQLVEEPEAILEQRIQERDRGVAIPAALIERLRTQLATAQGSAAIADQQLATAKRELDTAAAAATQAHEALEQYRAQAHPELRAAIEQAQSKHTIATQLVTQARADFDSANAAVATAERAFASGDTEAWTRVTTAREAIAQIHVRLEHARASERAAQGEVQAARSAWQRAVYESAAHMASPAKFHETIVDDLAAFARLESEMVQCIGRIAARAQRYNFAIARVGELAQKLGTTRPNVAGASKEFISYLCRRVVREARALRRESGPQVQCTPVDRQGISGVVETDVDTTAIRTAAERSIRK